MIRSRTFVLAATTFLFICFLLYSSLDSNSGRRREYLRSGRTEVGQLERRLADLERELAKNEGVIDAIRKNVESVVGTDQTARRHGPNSRTITCPCSGGKNYSSETDVQACVVDEQSNITYDHDEIIQLLPLYEMLHFDNPDGGVWKQGWDIGYDKDKVVTEEPTLQVVVVPHSHCDPGWIKTFEKYYGDQVKNILSGMVSKLSTDKDMRFIYAEMSFFERWWRDIDHVTRNAVKKILGTGQFEIVTGGWVMSDEANSHYFTMLDQLIEGHQWVVNHLGGFKPRSHWSIDPFGLGTTMAYLIRRANLTAMTIQRVHYSVKKHLARNQQLEFLWRQHWAGSSSETDVLAHVMPFYSYDIPHTCGPDPKVCCQFDFLRLPPKGLSCPWRLPPQVVTEQNVEERANLLLDQYRKKAQLYKTNVVLIPLGDDFRYDTTKEWERQHENYKSLFDNINSRKAELNAHVRFGTLSDYFTLVRQRLNSGQLAFPTLSGDFFTYADRDDHYWSGYFSSRPFYKRIDRMLQYHLRAAEIVYSVALSLMSKHKAAGFPFQELFELLVAARRNMGISQHHDAITGTAKDHVVVDYSQRMELSIAGCRQVIAAASHFILSKDRPSFRTELGDGNSLLEFVSGSFQRYIWDDVIANQDAVPKRRVILVDAKPRSLVVHNSLERRRSGIVCFRCDSPRVRLVEGGNGEVRFVQVNPVVLAVADGRTLSISADSYDICFEATVGAVGYAVYEVSLAEHLEKQTLPAKLESNFDIGHKNTKELFSATELRKGDGFHIVSSGLSASFDSKSGYLRSIKRGEVELAVKVSFVKYGARGKGHLSKNRGGDSLSGAYLFLPDGEATPLSSDTNQIVLLRGELFSEVHVKLRDVVHIVRVAHVASSLERESLSVTNIVDVSSEANFELAMRFDTAIRNGRLFHTDLNGFQILKRKRFDKLPLQANFYPMSSAAFIEDDSNRLSILSAQSLGASSLAEGSLEVILDRRLMQDDDRGLFQGVKDNKPTPEHFRILFDRSSAAPVDREERKLGFLSLNAHLSLLELNNPLLRLYRRELNVEADLTAEYSAAGLSPALPCDVHLVNVRTLQRPARYSSYGDVPPAEPDNRQALILHRFLCHCDCAVSAAANCPDSSSAEPPEVKLDDVFGGELRLSSAEEYSLTMLDKQRDLDAPYRVSFKPMDLRTFKNSVRKKHLHNVSDLFSDLTKVYLYLQGIVSG